MQQKKTKTCFVDTWLVSLEMEIKNSILPSIYPLHPLQNHQAYYLKLLNYLAWRVWGVGKRWVAYKTTSQASIDKLNLTIETLD